MGLGCFCNPFCVAMISRRKAGDTRRKDFLAGPRPVDGVVSNGLMSSDGERESDSRISSEKRSLVLGPRSSSSVESSGVLSSDGERESDLRAASKSAKQPPSLSNDIDNLLAKARQQLQSRSTAAELEAKEKDMS